MSDSGGSGLPLPGNNRQTPAAGWYHDPTDPSLIRWWDGRDWTSHLQRPPTVPAPPAASAPEPDVLLLAGVAATAASLPATAALTRSDLLAAAPAARFSEPAYSPNAPFRSADILAEATPVAARSTPNRRTLVIASAAAAAVLVVAAVGASTLGVFSGAGDTGAVPGGAAAPVAVAMAPNASPKVGDCFTGPASATPAGVFQVGSLKRLPCSEHHVLEVYALSRIVGPLPAATNGAAVAAVRRCPSPSAFLGDHYLWVERFEPVPIVGTSAAAKGDTWMACAVGLSGAKGLAAVAGSSKAVISGPGAMTKYGLCTPATPIVPITIVPCRANAGMWLLSEVAIGTPGSVVPGHATVTAMARRACAVYRVSTAPHSTAVLTAPPSDLGWVRGQPMAAWFQGPNSTPSLRHGAGLCHAASGRRYSAHRRRPLPTPVT